MSKARKEDTTQKTESVTPAPKAPIIHEEHDNAHQLISPLDGQRIELKSPKQKAKHGFEYDVWYLVQVQLVKLPP